MFFNVFCALIATIVVWWVNIWRKHRDIDKKLQWIGKVAGIPLLGNTMEFKDPTTILLRMEQRLLENNGLCRIQILSRTMVLISDYNFVEWLLTSTNILDKSIDYQFLYRWLEGGILIADAPEWRPGRKILTPAFHFSILENFVAKFSKPTTILIDILKKESDKDSVNIHPIIANFTLDIICETAMGVEINAQENPQSKYVRSVHTMCKIVVERAFNPLKTNDFIYNFTLDNIAERKAVKYLHSTADAVIKMKREEQQKEEEEENDDVGGKKRVAFLDLLLRHRDENGQPLSDNCIRKQVNTIMFAGHDTTASALCFTLFCLSNHLDEQEKALREIKEVSHEEDTFTYRNLQDMKYLDLIIKEAIRLYPSVPFYSRRLTKDVVYEGSNVLAKDITLIICAHAINRNPNVFKEPEKFIPSRFLETNIKPFSFLPFSAGPRNCIGQKFAMLEMKYVLAKILLNFEVLPANPPHNPIISAETVLISKNGIKLRFRNRK
ncbi:putative cytochrome P450 4d14 isoform X2 [Rhynchophorus ferrugineus]|uniref:putative cytochrome P450 4d14 isoform X2 n=1 Tax=Rhynchophorus ferrugineus TaxID=354439 RepID=UPI003FCDBA4B